jgi:Cdc6-like AAA superfamily ATPase
VGCKDVIDHVFMDTHEKDQGNNGLIFVYGNTGTGKTYSMGLLNLMSHDSEGIVPNSLRYIFEMKSN